MNKHKLINLIFAVMVIASLIGGNSKVSAMPMNPTDETEVPHYFGPYPNWANSPFTLPDAIVTISPPAFGNALTDQFYPTDGVPNVLAINTHAPLPAGNLTAFQTWAQAGSGPNTFNAYVLRPTGIPNEFTVIFDSGLLTVADGALGLQSFPLAAPVPVLAGDLIAHYGQGIPLTEGGGLDTTVYPAGPAPVLDQVFTIGYGDPTYPIYNEIRTYSINAVVDTGLTATATADAAVGANGAITGITVTDPGSGYTVAPVVTISGSGTGAQATASVTLSGMVTGIMVDTFGAGYTAPFVDITGGGGTGASATPYGGVDAVTFAAPNFEGSGYTMPTVEFDLPDDPNGVQAQGHAECVGDPVGGPYCVPANPGDSVTLAQIVVDAPGSGYSFAPGVAVHNGTLNDPVPLNAGGWLASASTSLFVDTVVMNTFGSGYTSVPSVAIGDPNGFLTEATAHAQHGPAAIPERLSA